jgi:hypothetical protein
MDERTRLIRGLARHLADLSPSQAGDVGLIGVTTGALHSLLKAHQLGYKDQRGRSRNSRAFANEFRTTLKRLGKGESLPRPYLAGFYFVSALWRLSALLHRLQLPIAARSRSRLVHDVDWIKHSNDAHPVLPISTMWEDALMVASTICSAMIERLP